jgi:hypothetical protein
LATLTRSANDPCLANPTINAWIKPIWF